MVYLEKTLQRLETEWLSVRIISLNVVGECR